MLVSSPICNGVPLAYDQACLQVQSLLPVRFFSQSTGCEGCDYELLGNVFLLPKEFIISTVYPTKFKYESCSYLYPFEEHGVYGLNISLKIDDCAKLFVNHPPDNQYESLWFFGVLVLGLLFFWILRKCFIENHSLSSLLRASNVLRELQDNLGRVESPTPPPLLSVEFSESISPIQSRVYSLDAFRGLTVLLMIFVNVGGGSYSIFQHSPWNGLTVADVIFPWFVWILGFSATLFVKSQLRLNRRKSNIIPSILIRSLILVSLGLCVNSFKYSGNDINHLRLPGVLQRLGFTYFIITSLRLIFARPEQYTSPSVVVMWSEWMIGVILAASHAAISLGTAAPGCPEGYLGPGGLHDGGLYVNCTGGVAGYLDRVLLGKNHLYQNPSPQPIYKTTVPYDPEGVLGLLTSVLAAFLGSQAAQVLQYSYSWRKRVFKWLSWSLFLGISGYLVSKAGFIPFNKNLWSVSYVAASVSLAFLVFSILFILIDVLILWDASSLVGAGRNSLLLYVGSILTEDVLPWSWKPVLRPPQHFELLLMNITCVLLWFLIASSLHHKKMYVSL